MQTERKGVRVDELRRLVDNQRKREASCLFVPCWIMGCILTALAAWLHSAPGQAAAAETPISRWILSGADPSPELSSTSAVYSASDVPSWVQSTLIPLLMTDNDGTTAVNQFRLLGGLRVSQWRLPSSTCPTSIPNRLLLSLGLAGDNDASTPQCMTAVGAAVYTGTDDAASFLDGRWSEGRGSSGAVFASGTPPCDPTDVSIALRSRNVSSGSALHRLLARAATCTCATAGSAAAVPSIYKSGFHSILPVMLGPTLNSDLLESVSWAGAYDTVDAGTQGYPAYVRVQAVGINPASARWMSAAWDMTFSSTGSVRVKSLAGSLPWEDPAAVVPLSGIVDAAAVLMVASLLVQGALGLAKTASACYSRHSKDGKQASALNPWSPSAWLGWVLDWATALYVAMAINSWMQLTSQLSALSSVSSANAASLTTLSPSTDTPSTCYTGLPSTDTLLATMQLHDMLNGALTLQAQWRFQCGIAAALLIVKILRVMSLQPRVGIFLEAIKEGLGELSHFGLVFITLLLGHGLWAGLAFGAQDAAFTTIPDGLFALLRMAMFDYDLAPLLNQDPVGASLFYASFMLIVTHISLWTWLGIALETFSLIRNASKERLGVPDVLTDVHSGMQHMSIRAVELAHAIRSVLPDSLAEAAASSGLHARQRLDEGSSAGSESPPVYRHTMLAYHTRVLQALDGHERDHITVDALARSMSVSVEATKAILQHYIHGDDVSQSARYRFAAAMQDNLSAQNQGKSNMDDAGQSGVSSHSSSAAGSQPPTSAAGTGADEWESTRSGHLPRLELQVTSDVRSQRALQGAGVSTMSSATAASAPSPSPQDSSTPLPTSPLGLHHEGKYISVRGMMVRRPSKSDSGMGDIMEGK